MADSPKPHFPLSDHSSRIQPKPINHGNSCSAFILKSLFLALFLIVLPLFPSQPPHFVSQTILNKFWELLHLLFIGIAVTYGLFSRRNSELDTPHIEVETTHSSADDATDAPSYVSKVFPASTIFYDDDDGCQNKNPCAVDGKRRMVMQCWNPQYIDGGPGVECSNGGSTVAVFDEQYKSQLPISQDSFGYSVRCDGNGNKVLQAWNSEYYHSEPVVVVAQPSDNKTGECGELVDYKPLGLPIRSLRSVARDVDRPKYANESDSSSNSRGSSRGSSKNGDREFGDLDPSNLEKKFNEAVAVGGSASPIPWPSRNRTMEREKVNGDVNRSSHFRPLPVDETEFEALGSRSLQSTTSFSSHTNMYSSLDSILLDNLNFQEEEIMQKEAAYVSASEKMNFREEDLGQRKTSFVPVSEIMNFQEEDIGSWKTSYVPVSENTTFHETDLGKKIFQGSSSRNRRMATKGKYGAASFPSHFRPKSVDETQLNSLGLNSMSFDEAVRSFSSNGIVYSSLDTISSNMDFQEEDMGQKKTSYMHISENMNFQEEDIGHKTSYVHDSENVNFQEEDMEQKNTSYVPASESRNFQEVDLVKKGSQVSSSRNGTIECKGKYAADSRPSHFRPVSVDETQLESLSSRSFQSMGSFSSQSSLCSSLDSALSENMNSPKEDLEKKSSHGSSSSPSPLAKRNDEASLQAFQACGYTNGSLLPDDIKSCLNDDLRGLNEIEDEDPRKKESRMHALLSDSEKPANIAKAPSRGKSVRTRRASGLSSGTLRIVETSSKQTDEKVEKNLNNVESVLRKEKMKNGEPDLPSKRVSKRTMDSCCSKPEVKFSNRSKRDKLEKSQNLSKQDSDIELENSRVSSDESGVPEFVTDSDLDSEVDKKASEFIAKFKAQIRLQKMGSIERSKEQKTTQNKIG